MKKNKINVKVLKYIFLTGSLVITSSCSNTINKIDTTLGKPIIQDTNSKFQINKVMSELLKVKKSPEIIINDVLIDDKSIMGENKTPQTSIQPLYSGNVIQIKIKGIFTSLKNVKLEDSIFTYEPPIINQSFTYNDNTPKFRVLIDDSNLLAPQSVSNSEIIVNLDTRSTPDFYLKGYHKLSVINNGIYTDTLVLVNQSEEYADLKPSIESAEIIKNEGKSTFIKLKGKNFMIYPKFSYSIIDDNFAFGYQTNIIANDENDSWETLIQIPKINEFDKKAQHTISYQTPFGIANINI